MLVRFDKPLPLATLQLDLELPNEPCRCAESAP